MQCGLAGPGRGDQIVTVPLGASTHGCRTQRVGCRQSRRGGRLRCALKGPSRLSWSTGTAPGGPATGSRSRSSSGSTGLTRFSTSSALAAIERFNSKPASSRPSRPCRIRPDPGCDRAHLLRRSRVPLLRHGHVTHAGHLRRLSDTPRPGRSARSIGSRSPIRPADGPRFAPFPRSRRGH